MYDRSTLVGGYTIRSQFWHFLIAVLYYPLFALPRIVSLLVVLLTMEPMLTAYLHAFKCGKNL